MSKGKICNVKKIYEVRAFEWKITDFFSIFNEKTMHGEKGYVSPIFVIQDTSFRLGLQYELPVGTGKIGLICVEGRRKDKFMEYYFGIKKADGSIEQMATGIMKRKTFVINIYNIIKLSEIQQRKSEVAPRNVLTITCSLKLVFIHFNQLNLLDEPKRKKLRDDSFLFQDYKKMFQEGKNFDLILKVRDKEFPVHRDILRARSKVFESMLNHDMKEKNSGVIEVPDCDPQAMEQFLLYLYCGGIETLDDCNVLGLYYIADKYDRQDLKEECRDFLKKSLSVTNVCPILQLAVNHSDSDLQERATQYFVSNVEDILRTSEWQSFQRDNQTMANELVIKSIQKLKNAKD